MVKWDEIATIHGIEVKAHFFNEDVRTAHTLAKRLLPFLKSEDLKPVWTEQDRKNFAFDEIIAQPDAVFSYFNGLISVEYKSNSGRSTSYSDWEKQIRLADMLQCIIAGYAVAQNQRKITGCVLRYHNVCFFLNPAQEVLETILGLVPSAKRYYGENNRISSTQLAKHCVNRIEVDFPKNNFKARERGEELHRMVLKKD